MNILKKNILNKAVTFLLTAVLLCGNAVQVEAYTALDGYPFVVDNFRLLAYQYDDNGNNLGYPIFNGQLMEQNSYHFQLDDTYDYINSISFGNENGSLVVPFNLDIYDYYVVGSFYCSGGGWTVDNFQLDNAYFYGTPENGTAIDRVYSVVKDFKCLDFVNRQGDGFSFYGKINVDETSNLSYLRIAFNDNNLSLSGDCWFSASIVPVPKGSEAEQLNQSILNELIKINQNLVTSNSLQQSTIDAINNHDTNVGNWFTTLTGNLGNWIATLTNKVGLGFEALYNQMTKEQDEQLYGYQDTTTSEAASAFSSESDKLTALEGELSTQSNTYVSDYAAEGFDLGVLGTIGSSLIFVTTWFTNFWNMGGVFTACLNFCFALSIVFFILRIKR